VHRQAEPALSAEFRHKQHVRVDGVGLIGEDVDKLGGSTPLPFDRTIVALPCGSASTNRTRLPSLAKPTAVLMAQVDFPGPPFSDSQAIDRTSESPWFTAWTIDRKCQET